MAKIFKKIRRKMIRDKKVINYILYAIGEIILVVIGILIALSINNSNELKKTRDAEKVYLKEMAVYQK
jgi:mevalonate kinase